MSLSLPVRPSSLSFMCRTNQLRELLGGISWLKSLDDTQLDNLLTHGHLTSVREGEWVFHQEAPAAQLYVMVAGTVRLIRSAREGSRATIRHAIRGDMLGELSMVSVQGRYLYAAEVRRTVHLLALPTQICRQLLEDQPLCRADFMSRLALELADRLEDLALVTEGDAMTRLISYLLREVPANRVSTPFTLRLNLPKAWLAQQLAMKPETLSRLLAKLRDQRIIDIERHRLIVLDYHALHKLVKVPTLGLHHDELSKRQKID